MGRESQGEMVGRKGQGEKMVRKSQGERRYWYLQTHVLIMSAYM